MSADVSNAPPSPDGTKNIRVLIDRTPEMVAKDTKISELEQELGKMRQYNEALLSEHKKEYVEPIEPKKPPKEDTNTAIWGSDKPERSRETWELDINSPIPLFIKGENTQQVITFLKNNAARGNTDAERLLKALYIKARKAGGTFEYQGNMCRWERRGNETVRASRPREFKKVED